MRNIKFVFITGNKGKYEEARRILGEYGLELYLDSKRRKVEIQSESLEEIVDFALVHLECAPDEACIIEDDGLFIEALGGFPGPYSAYVYKTIGLKGVLKLMEGVSNRRAYFKSVVGVKIGGERALFTGVVHGFISERERGVGGFGFDPIFIPEGHDRTFAELGVEVKNKISHRARAFRALGEWVMKLARADQ